MRNCLLLVLICGLISSCGSEEQEEAFFLTKLGKDTLAVERFELSGNQLKADVILRSPSTSLRRYEMTWGERNQLSDMTVTDFTDQNSFNAPDGKIVQKVRSAGDSLEVVFFSENGDRSLKVENLDNLIPFVDMVHWPYELAFTRASTNTSDSIDQYMLSGRRNANFIIHRLDDTSFTLRHPSRGVMEVTTSNSGELMSLDAGQTTRKLKVERAFDLSFDQLAASFVENDKITSPFGTLSPPVTNAYYFKNTEFEVSYGSPAKRGREIFGGIVPYGQRWRTGANRATHFKTTRALMIQGQRVPAGEYTLFTIPEADNGTLIINKQTGQNGQSYDESRDLMRVELKRTANYPVVESFTISVEETKNGGRLNLMWDRSIFYIDFGIL